MDVVKVCRYMGCGKEFIAHSNNARWCPECKVKREEDKRRAANERKRVARKMAKMEKPARSVQDIAAMAREAGMTYGQYVAREGK